MTNLAFLIVMFIAPVGLLFYALAGRNKAETAKDFLYGGLTVRAAIYSTIGTVLGTGFTVGLIIGATGFFGWSAAIAILFFLVVIYPAALYFVLHAPAVRKFFKREKKVLKRKKSKLPQTLFSFLVAPDADPALARFTAAYMVMLLLLYAFVEFLMCYAVLLYIYGPYISAPWIVYAILAFVVISYVAIGGYPAVLRTDQVQFFTTVALVILVSALLWQIGDAPVTLARDAAAADTAEESGSLAAVGPRSHEIADLVSSFALVIAAGAWLMMAPDMWFRLTRIIYGFPKASRIRVQKSQAPWTVFLTIALLFLPVAGAAVLLGMYGVAPSASAQEPTAQMYGEGTQWTLAALIAVEGIVSNQELGMLFPALFLLLMSLAFMSTIDTAIITAMQVHADYRSNVARRAAKVHIRSLIVGVAVILALVPLILAALGEKWFLGTAANLGYGMALLTTGTFCVFIARSLVPNWAPRRSIQILTLWLGPLVAIGLILLVCRATGAFPGAEPGQLKAFSNIGLMVLLYFLTYGVFIAGVVIGDIRSRRT